MFTEHHKNGSTMQQTMEYFKQFQPSSKALLTPIDRLNSGLVALIPTELIPLAAWRLGKAPKIAPHPDPVPAFPC